MSAFIEVGSTDTLKNGSMKTVMLEGQPVLVVSVGEKYYAVQKFCPHMGGDLSLGKLEGTVLTCPVHHSQFDLTDGRVLRWTDWTGMRLSLAKVVKSPRPLQTYEVRVEGNKILIGNKKALTRG